MIGSDQQEFRIETDTMGDVRVPRAQLIHIAILVCFPVDPVGEHQKNLFTLQNLDLALIKEHVSWLNRVGST